MLNITVAAAYIDSRKTALGIYTCSNTQGGPNQMSFTRRRDINKLLLPWAAVLSHFLSCNFGTDRFRHWLSVVESGLS